MKSLRNPTKCDTLLNLFDEIGKSMSVKNVCDITGIKNYNSLKALFSYIRKAPHISPDNRIDVRIKDDVCIRIN
jgi:hypothetical protein